MIPTKEQFIELNGALNKSIEFIEGRLNSKFSAEMSNFTLVELSEYGKNKLELESPEKRNEYLHALEKQNELRKSLGKEFLSEFIKPDKFSEFIKPDVDLYLEYSEASQNLAAWKWLHSQQNFTRAKKRAFNEWPEDENVGNGLVEFIAKTTIDRSAGRFQDRDLLLSGGSTSHEKWFEEWLVKHSPLEILQSELERNLRFLLRYKKWVAGVALAVSNYLHGESGDMALMRKDKVDGLITAWFAFCKHIELAQSDPEIGEYLSHGLIRLIDDRQLTVLRALHQTDTLYSIGRNDETVLERLFVREITLLHRKIFGVSPRAGMIADLFYLDGMKSSLSERAIQRIVKSTLVNRKKMLKVKSDTLEFRRMGRQIIVGKSSTTVGQ
jgi:hypothetical protein